eukprot:COSAG04_NODE_9711_length_838_cov_0.905277_1_plen_98_part_10
MPESAERGAEARSPEVFESRADEDPFGASAGRLSDGGEREFSEQAGDADQEAHVDAVGEPACTARPACNADCGLCTEARRPRSDMQPGTETRPAALVS